MRFSFSSTSQSSLGGFTIIELLMALFIISLVILGIVSMINSAANHTNKIRQETIAINFAREGMEGMYTRRNTNWLQRPAEKDIRWLCTDNACSERFYSPSIYFMLYSTGGQVYFENRTNHGNESSNNRLLLQEDNMIGGTNPAGGSFYRGIHILGLYQKDVNLTGGSSITSCRDGTSDTYNSLRFDGSIDNSNSLCGDNKPKELLFCSRVEYTGLGAGNGNVELCGSLTNYQE